VEIVSIADGFSMDGPAAEVIPAVMSWAAKMERVAITERISPARERMEVEGGRWERPAPMDEELLSGARQFRDQGTPSGGSPLRSKFREAP
jgi:DNA invertase Pin-like site-specific DNA recombinase